MDGKKITRLVAQQKNSKRVNVYLDDEFAFGLSQILALPLHIGQTLSEQQIKELRAADHDESLFLRAAALVDIRPRSEAEIRKKLNDIGAEADDINKTVERLRQEGLLNDELFSKLWVDSRVSRRPRSRRMIQYELRQKGVSDDVIRASLENVDDFQTAFELAESRSFRWTDLEKSVFRKKLVSFLAGKGYSYDIIDRVYRRLWKSLQSEEEDSIEEYEDYQ